MSTLIGNKATEHQKGCEGEVTLALVGLYSLLNWNII